MDCPATVALLAKLRVECGKLYVAQPGVLDSGRKHGIVRASPHFYMPYEAFRAPQPTMTRQGGAEIGRAQR